jgi:phage terminase large subunit-like protein
MAPHERATTAISLLRDRMGDRIIAETNNGGEMVQHTLRMVHSTVPFSAVWASRAR